MNNALVQLMKDGCHGNGVPGSGPLTNEIKIFKHCFTILLGPHALFLVTFVLLTAGLCDIGNTFSDTVALANR